MPYSEVFYNSPPFFVFLSIYMLPRYFVNALITLIKIIYTVRAVHCVMTGTFAGQRLNRKTHENKNRQPWGDGCLKGEIK